METKCEKCSEIMGGEVRHNSPCEGDPAWVLKSAIGTFNDMTKKLAAAERDCAAATHAAADWSKVNKEMTAARDALAVRVAELEKFLGGELLDKIPDGLLRAEVVPAVERILNRIAPAPVAKSPKPAPPVDSPPHVKVASAEGTAGVPAARVAPVADTAGVPKVRVFDNHPYYRAFSDGKYWRASKKNPVWELRTGAWRDAEDFQRDALYAPELPAAEVAALLAATPLPLAEQPPEPPAATGDRMNIYSRPGVKVQFDAQAGCNWDIQNAKEQLELGSIYTVSRTIVSRSSSAVELMERPGKIFNTVLFAIAPWP